MMRPYQLPEQLLSPLTKDYMHFTMGRMQAIMAYHRYTCGRYLGTGRAKYRAGRLLLVQLQCSAVKQCS